MAAAEPDYYLVLGVSEAATEAEIRTAYRRAARACHPDVNPTDPTAIERFKAVQRAYDVLGDPARRAQYRRPRTSSAGTSAAPAVGQDGAPVLPRELQQTLLAVRVIARMARPRLTRRFNQLVRYLESLDRQT